MLRDRGIGPPSVKWNPDDTTTFGPRKIGLINRVAVIKGFFK